MRYILITNNDEKKIKIYFDKQEKRMIKFNHKQTYSGSKSFSLLGIMGFSMATIFKNQINIINDLMKKINLIVLIIIFCSFSCLLATYEIKSIFSKISHSKNFLTEEDYKIFKIEQSTVIESYSFSRKRILKVFLIMFLCLVGSILSMYLIDSGLTLIVFLLAMIFNVFAIYLCGFYRPFNKKEALSIIKDLSEVNWKEKD